MTAGRVRPFARILTVAAVTVLAGCGGSTTKPRAENHAPPGVAVAPTRPSAEGSGDPTATDAPAATRAAPATTSATVRRWPRTLQIGLIDGEDQAKALRARAPYGFRWHYLSGGAGTSTSWDQWRTGDGSFATAFTRDARSNGTIPFFSYYVLQQTPPTSEQTTEQEKVVRGLANATVMRRVVADLRLALRRIGAAGSGPAVLQVEPDLWGYAQQRFGDDAGKVPVRLHGSDPAARGLPDTLTGFARLVSRIRDTEAPSTLLAYPVSIFGTHKDIVGSQPSAEQVDQMVASSVRFWRSAGRPWDLLTFEYANRDAGYANRVEGVPRAQVWWTATDYERHLQYVRGVLRATGRPGILWQVPPGNTVSPAMDDSPGHYGDDKVEHLLGQPRRPLLRQFRDAGIAAVLFGSAFPNDTCACPRNDPYASPGGADDDGGYLATQVRRYARQGPLPLRRVPHRVRG